MTRRWRRSGSQGRDVREVPVALGTVHAIAGDEVLRRSAVASARAGCRLRAGPGRSQCSRPAMTPVCGPPWACTTSSISTSQRAGCSRSTSTRLTPSGPSEPGPEAGRRREAQQACRASACRPLPDRTIRTSPMLPVAPSRSRSEADQRRRNDRDDRRQRRLAALRRPGDVADDVCGANLRWA